MAGDRGGQRPSTRKRHPKSQQRWDRIVTAAIRLFNERGFAATSVQDISDAVELQKGSLYYYVESKELLLFEILRDLHCGGEVLVTHVNFGSLDALGELRAFIIQLCLYSERNADRLRIFARDFHFLDRAQQDTILRERLMYRTAVERLIDSAVAQGQITGNVDRAIAAQTVLHAVTGTYEWFRPDGRLTIEQVAVQTAMILIQGLAGFR